MSRLGDLILALIMYAAWCILIYGGYSVVVSALEHSA